MKKLLFGFGILVMLFATVTIYSCGDAESTDEKSELQEGEEKACCKDKDCKDKDCKGKECKGKECKDKDCKGKECKGKECKGKECKDKECEEASKTEGGTEEVE